MRCRAEVSNEEQRTRDPASPSKDRIGWGRMLSTNQRARILSRAVMAYVLWEYDNNDSAAIANLWNHSGITNRAIRDSSIANMMNKSKNNVFNRSKVWGGKEGGGGRSSDKRVGPVKMNFRFLLIGFVRIVATMNCYYWIVATVVIDSYWFSFVRWLKRFEINLYVI